MLELPVAAARPRENPAFIEQQPDRISHLHLEYTGEPAPGQPGRLHGNNGDIGRIALLPRRETEVLCC